MKRQAIALISGLFLIASVEVAAQRNRGALAAPASEAVARAAASRGADMRLPRSVDLRGRLRELGLTPRAQGARGTCSIFTTCEAIEFAAALHSGRAVRLSPEFLNWAGGQAAGRACDGNFFHNALAGYEKYGLCTEALMPYGRAFYADKKPSSEALADAAGRRDAVKGSVVVRWIMRWKADRAGVSAEDFAEIQRVLARGWPVAAGAGHSRLLVGYRDDAKLAGGGAFLTEDSALNRFDEVTYEFVRKQVADVFWVEAVKAAAEVKGVEAGK